MSSPAGELFRTMMVRVSPDDIVLYANGAIADYLQVSKAELLGAPLETLSAWVSGEISTCFQRPESGKSSNRLVTDDVGRVFEVKTYSEGGMLDIVLDEVTTPEAGSRALRDVSGTSVDILNEEELRTTRQPERRFLTISHSRLNGLTHLTERLTPMEIRLMVNSFVEEAADAVLETGCSVYQASGEVVVGIFGAPRYFADHAIRAVRTAFSQIEKSAQLRSGFYRQGKEVPLMSCGIWSGETFVGTLGSSTLLRYAAIGQPVDMAAELCRLARPGEVLVSEFTLRSLLQCLPPGWQAVRTESEADPDLSDFHWVGDEVVPIPKENVRGVWLIGPGIEEDASKIAFYLQYLWALKVPDMDEPVPVLRAVQPVSVGDSLELSVDNVVPHQFTQMLGKYKLLSVIGTGGMGKVWKGKDRYGNLVAIKVLHSGETASDVQLKRFRREAEIMARLPHRNICHVFEMNEFEGIHYIVMEFVDGLTLADLIYDRTAAESSGEVIALPDLQSLIQALRTQKSSRVENGDKGEEITTRRSRDSRILPIEQTLNIFLKVCDAVRFAHEHGVLHRDLKPGNILLREDGEPLVADFGLAKMDSAESGQSLSVSGNVVGTIENMSPEQAESSKAVDERADVYSLGTILFQMLCGHRHFEATGNIVADAQALQTHEPPRPRKLNKKLDSDLEIILLKSLRNIPAQRYRSVAALKADIERYSRGEAISARPVSAFELARKLMMRNRAISAVIAASLLLLIAGSIIAFWQIREQLKMTEKALAEAQRQGKLAYKAELRAQEQKREAQQKQKQAEEQEVIAAQALNDAKIAWNAEAEARERTATAEQKAADALNQVSAAQSSESEISTKLDEAQRILEKMKNEHRERMTSSDPMLQTERLLKPPILDQAYGPMGNAMMDFRFQLSPVQLARYDHNPEEILRRLQSGLDNISRILLGDPTLTPGWLLKGRYHLACFEIEQATQAFQMAVDVAARRNAQGTPNLLGPEDPAALLSICEQLSKVGVDRFGKGSKILAATESPENQIISNVLAFFRDKPLAKKTTLSALPTGRTPASSELALDVMARNKGIGHVQFNDGTRSKDITISGIENLGDLTSLKALAPAKICIEGAAVLDWAMLANFPLESLDLSKCRIDRFPFNLRGFLRLRTLSVKDTGLLDLNFVRGMTLLENLDISGTAVSDLTPLFVCKRLQILNAGRLGLDNLRMLLSVPLTRLTISPMMISDKAALNSMRQHRTLKILRTPDDPDDQPAAEFWRKLDAGDYETVGE